MGRSFSLISILLAAGFPAACSFSTASEGQITMDSGAVGSVDVRLPQSDGGTMFQSDANVTCVGTKPMTTNLPPDILIVFDRSGSMLQDLSGMACGNAGCGATSKWTIATTTMTSFLPTVENTVNWGLKLFASPGNGRNAACAVSAGVEAPPRGGNAAAITTLLGAPNSAPGSSTPTTLAVRNAADYLKQLTDANPKFILLVTDGIPTCGMAMCAPGVDLGGGSATQCDDANAIAMVKTVHDEGYPTFVLGVGTSGSPGDSTLSQMATNGGFPRSGSPSYYPIDQASDLTAAFQTITGMVGNCFFAVSPPLKSGQLVSGVTADGATLAPGDYTIIGNNGVQLVGQKCDDFTKGTIKNISVQVSCNG